MAFDGITIAALTKELKEELVGARLYKIAQTESDELLLTFKSSAGQRRLLISASASLPLLYFTENNKPSPLTAPAFCMLLRKHLQNGRITDVTQPGLERIVRLHIEHLDELGDLRTKTLVVELMGKHSNIIFCNDQDIILDSIKHISGLVSSLREVLPGKPYFIPATQDKAHMLSADQDSFRTLLLAKPIPIFKAIYTSYTGISPMIAQELCHRADLDADRPGHALLPADWERLYRAFHSMAEDISQGHFRPCIAYNRDTPTEYAAFPLTIYSGSDDRLVSFSSMSQLLENYYAVRNTITRIRQKSTQLRHVVTLALERNIKKYDLQQKQIQDTKKRDIYRVYGELLHTYGYSAAPASTSIEVHNYYTDSPLTIPLDSTLTASENAARYFDKYNKLKRTDEALGVLTAQVAMEIQHLQSILASLDIALSEEDLVQIRQELADNGYIKHRNTGKKKEKVTSRPFHYLSTDGYHIYVGKNNYQNEELTFQFANGNDWWFHAKGIPGSHVILKVQGDSTPPDRVFEEAGRLAAHYSQARGQEKVEIDYIQKKHVKKPGGGKPGFVVYYTNYSLLIDSDISSLQEMP